MSDPTAALAKMAEKALLASQDLDSPAKLCAAAISIWLTDRTLTGGHFAGQASKILDAMFEGIKACTGADVKLSRDYVWHLACRYGKMAAEASTPSKMEIIHAAFFSEFNDKFANDANVAMFRGLVEKLDYNEAEFLAGLWSALQDRGECSGALHRSLSHADYHTARSLLSKGELLVVVVLERDTKITIASTPALGRFIQFIGLTAKNPIDLRRKKPSLLGAPSR